MVIKELNDTELEKYLQTLVNKKRLIEAEILLILSEVKKRNLIQKQGFVSLAAYCESRLGLSRDQAWKRSQATSVIEIVPETLNMLKNGETHISGLALIAPKLTLENKDKILDFLPKASKADLCFFLQTIDQNGNKIDLEPTVTLKLKFSPEMLEKLERLQGLLVQSQIKGDKESTIERALDTLLEKIDPIRKEIRRENRQTKKLEKTTVKVKEEKQSTTTATTRALPEAIKAKVLKRDGYRCTHSNSHGERCKEKTVLQIDHIQPWAIGGKHELANLRTFCRSHNLMMADKVFGKDFMDRKKKTSDPLAATSNGEAMTNLAAKGSQPSEQRNCFLQRT